MYNAVGTTLGTGSTTGAKVGSPDKLLASSPARYFKLMFRILGCYFFPKQVLEG